MRTALIGARGQLGTDLGRLLPGDVVSFDRDRVDISDRDSVHAVLSTGGFDRVVNCAAYNLVDRAEEEPERAFIVNGLGPRNLALACTEIDALLVHVGTDYVFGADEARRVPYGEDDRAGPTSAYGTSKLAGEQFAASLCPRSLIVRTCGLYGQAEGRANFVRTMLRLGRERGTVSVVDDQRCTPTATADLAEAIVGLIEADAVGLFHMTNAGDTTWCEFAREIFRLAEVDCEVMPITTAEFGARARRPAYSVLDGSKAANVLGREQPTWQTALAEYIAEATPA